MNEQFIKNNGQFAVHETQRLNQTITGILTSRIETRQDYHYGFFKSPNLVDPKAEFPVIFKENKPNLSKGSTIKLQGTWSSGKDRPSFTCQTYQIIAEPQPLTLLTLREQLQPLFSPALKNKEDWTKTVDFLFKKQEELKSLEKLSKLGHQYLQAYLLLKNAEYSASSQGKLILEDFNQAKYLTRIAAEIEPLERQIKAQQAKSQALDNFAEKSLQITSQALHEKDLIIKNLQLANCTCQEVKNA